MEGIFSNNGTSEDVEAAINFVKNMETLFANAESMETRIEILKAFCMEKVETTIRKNMKSSYKSSAEIPVSIVAKIFGWDFGESDGDD